MWGVCGVILCLMACTVEKDEQIVQTRFKSALERDREREREERGEREREMISPEEDDMEYNALLPGEREREKNEEKREKVARYYHYPSSLH